MADKLAPSTRHKFLHQGRVVYEWDQAFSEVNVYIPVPPGVRAKELYVEISTHHVRLGIKPNPPYIDCDLADGAKVSESYWTLEDGTLHLTLTKLAEGETWPSAMKGHEIDPMQQQADQQRLLLERFQAENPGFDFSQATFNGQAPNPRTFMRDLDNVQAPPPPDE